MQTKTEKILAVMNVLTWIAFILLMIKAGGILVSFCISLANPQASKNLYLGMNVYNLREWSLGHFVFTVVLMITISVLQAYIAYLLMRVLSKIKMVSPFRVDVSRTLERMSHFIIVIWIIVVLQNMHTLWLRKMLVGFEGSYISTDFIFFAGITFVISQIFKKGVEIQSENELTV